MTRLFLVAFTLSAVLACGGETPTPPAETPAKRGKAKRGRAKAAVKATPQGEAPADAPNVLVIVWDTVRADHLSAYGYKLQTTPRLDAFAKEALLFEHAISPGMWTLPSHASIFTGLPVTAHGAFPGHKILDESFDTFAEHFRTNGYDTYLFSANPYLGDHTQLGQGFDTREFPWDAAWKGKAKANTVDKLLPSDASNSLAPKWKETKYPTGRMNDSVKDAGPVTADALQAWIKGRSEPGRPWLALLNYMEAHVPRIPSLEARKALFDQATVDRQLSLDQSFGYLLAHTVKLHDFEEDEVDVIASTYDASLRDLDAATGKLFDMLAEEAWLDDTIVILTSDHGEHLGEHHRIGHKFSVYQPLIRVPLVIRYPKKVEPGRVEEVVSNLGLFATMTDLAGLPTPEGLMVGSLMDDANRTNVAYSELAKATPQALIRMRKSHPDFTGEAWEPWEKTYAAVVTPDAKCIARNDGHKELYALPDDRLESNDLAATDTARTEELCGMIDDWRGTFEPYDDRPKPKATPKPELSDDDKERLKALGYMDDDE
jgi:arylsulfatase A-like enzyme